MTFQLILGSGALIVLAWALGLYPLLFGRQTSNSVSHRQVQLDIYAGRVKDLEAELQAGEIKQTDFDVALEDLERELAESGGLAAEQKAHQKQSKSLLKSPSGWVAVIAVLITPLAAVSIYLLAAGTPAAVNPELMQRQLAANAAQQQQMDEEEEIAQLYMMAEHLQRRLEAQPQDADSWVLLARTLVYLQHFEEAAAAYEMALSQGLTDDAMLLASYADVLAQVQGGFAGRPTELINMALAVDPNHGMSLWLAGTAAFQRGDWNQAEAHWQHLVNILPQDSEDVQILQRNLQEVARRKGEG